jgi:DNA-binding NarL/FixJ family response regulator
MFADFSQRAGIPVVVVEPHSVTRWGLVQLLSAEGEFVVVGEARTAAEAVALLDDGLARVVTISLSPPDGDGIVLARELRNRHPELGIVIITARDQDDVLFRALDSGASAFIGKTASVTETLSSIRHAAASAGSFTATGLADALRRRELTKLGVLSPREREVLQLLAKGHSIAVVAAALYVSVSTAKTHVARLYDKLGADNRAQALMIAVGAGLVNEPIPA